MGCMTKDQYNALSRLDRALRTLTNAGIGGENPVFSQIYRARGALMGNVGVRVPRSVSSLIKILGLSPGSVQLFFDADLGWVSDARETSGAAPVYHAIGDDMALKIIQGKITHEEFELLKVPDPYQGE